MTDVVGLPVSVAVERLTAGGRRITLVEARSRKGSGGNDERVIRVRTLPDGAVELTTARFVTLPDEGVRS